MIAKIHTIRQALFVTAGFAVCMLAVVSVFSPGDAVAATKRTFALSCLQGSVEVSKGKLSCSKGPDTVTVQGIGTKSEAKADGKPYPTTIGLAVVSVDCGTSSIKDVQLGDLVREFECQKGSPKSVKIVDRLDANPKAKPEVPKYSVDRASGETTGGNIKKPSQSDCKPTEGNCADCKNVSADGNAPKNCVDCTKVNCTDPAANPEAVCGKEFGCDLVAKYVNPTINLLSVGFGIIAVISLIIAGIQYSASAGDPQAVSKAKDRIIKTIFAIVAYFFLYALLQFLVPGGVFDRPA